MRDWSPPHTPTEVEGQMHIHDVGRYGHPKDWKVLAMFPISDLRTCTVVILRIGKDGDVDIELLTPADDAASSITAVRL